MEATESVLEARSLWVLLGAALLPVIFIAAGMLLLKSAIWMQRRAYAALVAGLVCAACYGLLLAHAVMEHSRVEALGYGALTIMWPAWAFWQYRAKKRAAAIQK